MLFPLHYATSPRENFHKFSFLYNSKLDLQSFFQPLLLCEKDVVSSALGLQETRRDDSCPGICDGVLLQKLWTPQCLKLRLCDLSGSPRTNNPSQQT